MPRWEPGARERLVEAALELFEQQGYDETGVAQIAERAGLTKTTLFRHFSDKRELLFAGQEHHTRLLFDTVAQAPADVPAFRAIGAALEALAATFTDDRWEFAARIQTVIDGHSELRERAALKRAGYLDALRAALQQRSVPDATAAVAADLGVLAFYTAFAHWVQDAAAGDLHQLVGESMRELHAASVALR